MAGLRARLARLEARKGGPDTTARDARAFLDRIGALGARVQAAGNFTDDEGASPAARYVRARLRGDDRLAETILAHALATAGERTQRPQEARKPARRGT